MLGGVFRNIAVAALVLRFVETFLIAGAILAGTAYITGHIPALQANELALPILAVLTIMTVMQVTGLYGIITLVDLRTSFSKIALVTAVIFSLAVVTTGELAKYDLVSIYPYRWQWTFGLTATWLICILAPRYILAALLERGLLARRIVAVSDNQGRERLADLSRMAPGRFLIAAEVEDSNSVFTSELVALAKRVGAPEVVISSTDGDGIGHLSVSRTKRSGVWVTDYDQFYERETGRVDLLNLQEGWFKHSQKNRSSPFISMSRRVFDVVIAVLAFVVSAPVMLITAIAIRIEDGRPVLFRQTRVGLNGQEFTLYKFRSMRVDAEVGGSPLWAAENDPRITRVGSFIRKLRIDELPQFYNVLRGDMSFVGPRPERPYFVHQLSEAIPLYMDRHIVKPGITGWAQVSFRYGASFEDARQKTAFDLYYVKHQSLLLDLLIMFRTVKVILWPQGVR